MNANLPEERQADEKPKRRFPIGGLFVWYFAGLWAVLVILSFCAVYLTVLLGLGGIGAWPIVAILAGSIVFASAVLPALGWAVRARKRRRAGGPPPAP